MTRWFCAWCGHEVFGDVWKTHGFWKCPAPFFFKLRKILLQGRLTVRFQSEYVVVPLKEVEGT